MRGTFMVDNAASREGGTGQSSSPTLRWMPLISDALSRTRSSYGFVLSEMPGTDRIGEVMNAIRGIESGAKYIKDGYQYVGDGPAHQWKLATADDQYPTMS